MNWYNKLKLKNKKKPIYKDIQTLLEQKILNPYIIKSIKELPPDITLREEDEGWSTIKEKDQKEHAISYNEPTLEHALKGTKARQPLFY